MEPINISFDNIEAVDLSSKPIGGPSGGGSDSLGIGIELLMNDKKKSSNSNIDIGDLNKLEDELNDLTAIDIPGPMIGGETERLGSFQTEPLAPPTMNTDQSFGMDEIKLDLENDSKLGSATANFVGQGSNEFIKPATSDRKSVV